MLANAPDVDRSTRTNRPFPEERSKGDVADVESAGLPVRRVGLEQEFFLVDRGGVLSDLTDPFLRRCRDARLRAWAEADDGKPVYMLNLMRYYDELRPFPGAPDFQGSPEESNTLYT